MEEVIMKKILKKNEMKINGSLIGNELGRKVVGLEKEKGLWMVEMEKLWNDLKRYKMCMN